MSEGMSRQAWTLLGPSKSMHCTQWAALLHACMQASTHRAHAAKGFARTVAEGTGC